MLGRLYSFLLIVLLLSKLGYSLTWQVHYELNKAEIAARYCENKNRPELHCNGQCYLAKQLKKADSALQAKEQEQQNHLDLGAKIISEQCYLPNDTPTLSLNIKFKYPKEKISCKENFYSFSIIQNCFHPPCMA
jgi:hypothetical protein